MTRRTELDPMSMTAIGWPILMRPCAGTSANDLTALFPAREAAGRRLFERFATARQTRIGHEVFVGVEWLFARRGLDTHRGAVGQEVPALLIVLEIRRHDLVENLLVHGGIENRAQHLDAAVEIARHHVGRRDVDRGFAMRQAVARAKAIDARVLKEPADDRLDADALGQSRHAGPQAADAADHEID